MVGGHDGRIDVPALTGVRAVAAWWVVIYHVRNLLAPFAPLEAMAFFAAGDLAVDLFFVLSGFVIYLNYMPRLTRDAGSIADFAMRRVARIYPLHLLILVAMVAYVAALYTVSGRPLPEIYSPWLVPLHLLLVQGWGVAPVAGWNVPSWSISTEFLAYLLFPLIALFADWRRRPAWLLGALILAAILLLHGWMKAHGYTTLGADIVRGGLPRCLAQFFIGTIICELFLRWRRHARWLAPVALAGAAAAVAGHLQMDWPETIAMPAAWTALVLGLSLWPWRFNPLASRPLVYLGDISYSTYLVHYLAYEVFKLMFVPDRAAVTPFVASAFFVIVLLASIVLYHGYERPAQRWVIDRWKRRSPGRPRLQA
jgi:peptidoglycan/LPS O-acetylase OafA/YrhL